MRCPVCKRNITAEPCCPRCGAGLEILHRIEQQAASLMNDAATALRQGDWDTAEKYFRESYLMKNSAESRNGFIFCRSIRRIKADGTKPPR